MRTITLTYHEEPGYGWFARSPDFILICGDPSFDEMRKLAREAVTFALECDESEVEIVERVEQATA